MKALKRCPKRVLNGPCGGMKNDGRCEIADAECVFLKNYPSELVLDPGFREKLVIKPRKPFTKLLSKVKEKTAWIAEMPPRFDVVKRIDLLRKVKPDALGIPDNPLGTLHIEASSFAAYLKNKTNAELMVHVTCRDLNRLALKSRILGLHLIKAEHVLALTGDHLSMGGERYSTGVFDLDSMRLIYLTRLLSDYGVDEMGKKIEEKPRLQVGAGLNPYIPLEIEASRISRKLEAGAEFFVTQLVFEKDPVENVLRKILELRENVPVFVSFLLYEPERIRKLLKLMGIPAVELPETVEKLAEKYLEVFAELRKIGVPLGVYVSTLGKLEYLRIWGEHFAHSV
ncbi:MAG: methylenetetrahydrofolate reductase C-terminal domain-containing protein [Thaumarchaeota archaeon]|nr:methylenetetrahydrofolate reductase C-terminal domain-containing protein [Nitrososphaerota archaeon]